MRPTEHHRNGAPQLLRAASRLASRLAAVVDECNYAQQRVMALRLAPDSYLRHPGTAPDSYGDFLFRTSGPLPREPSARARASGRPVAY